MTEVKRMHVAQYDGPDWKDWGRCHEIGPDVFYPEDGMRARDAKNVCQGCPVRERCLREALATPEYDDHGIWGGTSRKERIAMRRQARVATQVASADEEAA